MINQGIRGRGNTTSWVDVVYSSLDIPLLLRVNFLQSVNRFGIIAGPYYTLPLGQVKTKYENISYSSDYQNDIEASGFGITAGLFFARYLGYGNFIGDFRYVGDFNESYEVTSRLKTSYMKRRGITVTVGLEFLL